jgi:hypothetical protein
MDDCNFDRANGFVRSTWLEKENILLRILKTKHLTT